jgi:hypothetical protein
MLEPYLERGGWEVKRDPDFPDKVNLTFDLITDEGVTVHEILFAPDDADHLAAVLTQAAEAIRGG